jgi:hypothetical protein
MGWHNAPAELHRQLEEARNRAHLLEAELLAAGWVPSDGEGLLRDVPISDLEKEEIQPHVA